MKKILGILYFFFIAVPLAGIVFITAQILFSMKKMFSIIIVFLMSGICYSQPKKSITKETDLSVTIKYKVVSDTLTGSVITYDKEGYLQRHAGKVIRKISVFENQNIKPEVQSVSYYLENWTAIKPEDVFDFRAK